MKIVHLAAEFAPLAKVGGLGEVLVGLCRELSRMEEEVEVIFPKYDFIDVKKLPSLKMEVPDFKCIEKGNSHANAMWSAVVEESKIHLLEARHPSGYFHRGKIYNCEDDIARFLYFSRACLEYLKIRGEPIDILHLHDWHVAIAAVLAKDLFRLPIKAIVLSIHNAEYQGHCASWDLDGIGLKGLDYLKPEKMQDDNPALPQTINLLKGGIVYADAVHAVSPTYAKEILTKEKGCFLDATLRKYKNKVCGILNGIDQKLWDPAHDPALPKPYSAESPLPVILAAKQAARETIQKRFSLSKEHLPWIGAIARLVPQKGPEFLEEALRLALSCGAMFLFLGSSPIPKLQDHFDQLKKKYAKNPQVLLHYEYEETLSHQLYAALDLLLAPSHYEPCGLTQMIAMRYGTLPLVHATGGLKDTVFDCDDPAIAPKQRNGFSFHRATVTDFTATLQRAIHHYRFQSVSWTLMMQRVMQIDFGWKKPAQEYFRLYRHLTDHGLAMPSITKTPSDRGDQQISFA